MQFYLLIAIIFATVSGMTGNSKYVYFQIFLFFIILAYTGNPADNGSPKRAFWNSYMNNVQNRAWPARNFGLTVNC